MALGSVRAPSPVALDRPDLEPARVPGIEGSPAVRVTFSDLAQAALEGVDAPGVEEAADSLRVDGVPVSRPPPGIVPVTEVIRPEKAGETLASHVVDGQAAQRATERALDAYRRGMP